MNSTLIARWNWVFVHSRWQFAAVTAGPLALLSLIGIGVVLALSAGGNMAAPPADSNGVYPRVFQGTVTTMDGKPIGGALIEWGPDYPHDAPRESVLAADDGTYRIEVQKAGGKYQLGVSAAGCAPLTLTGLIPGSRSAPTELHLKLPAESTLRIVIVDESRQPIPMLELLPMTPPRGFNSSFSSVEQPAPIPGHGRPINCDAQGVCQLRQLPQSPEPLLKAEDSDTPAQAEYKQRWNQQGWLSLRITRGTAGYTST